MTGLLAKPLEARLATLDYVNIVTDTYEGSNAYNAKVEVERTEYDAYTFAFPGGGPEQEPPNPSLFTASTFKKRGWGTMSLDASVSGDVARTQAKNVACIYVMSPMAPYAFAFKERTLPTRDKPNDLTENGFALYGKLDQFAMFNKVTGEVYVRRQRTP